MAREFRTSVQAILYLVQGFGYVAYSLWRIVISPLEYFNAPEPFGLAAIVFFVLMFVAGGYFLVKPFFLFTREDNANLSSLVVPFFSVPLWLFPIYFIFGIALPSLSITPDLQDLASYFFQVGTVLSIVGGANIVSTVLVYLRWRAQRSRHRRRRQGSEGTHPVPKRSFKSGAQNVFFCPH